MATQPQYRFMERFSVEARQAALVDYVPGVYDEVGVPGFTPDPDADPFVEGVFMRYVLDGSCYCPIGLILENIEGGADRIGHTPSADDVVDLLHDLFGDLNPGEADEVERFIERFDEGYYRSRPMLARALGLDVPAEVT